MSFFQLNGYHHRSKFRRFSFHKTLIFEIGFEETFSIYEIYNFCNFSIFSSFIVHNLISGLLEYTRLKTQLPEYILQKFRPGNSLYIE